MNLDLELKKFVCLVILSLATYICVSQEKGFEIKTNSQAVLQVLEEFSDAAEFYQIDYQDGLQKIDVIFLSRLKSGQIAKRDREVLFINQALEEYPNLLRLFVFQQLGQELGLKVRNTSKRLIMSNVWRISPLEESYAYQIRKRNYQKMEFFKHLKQEAPVEYKF